MLDAFHLPALDNPPTASWSYGPEKARVELRLPRLTPELVRRQVDALLDARERHLAQRPVAELIEVIDAVAARMLDPGDPLRRAAQEALPAVTGYSPAMIRHVLDGMAAGWRADALRRLLAAELRDPAALDGFVARARGDGRTRAYGPRLAMHTFSGNVPGVAVTSLIRSLLVKAATLGKTAAGEPLLPALFARGVAEADAGLGACIAVAYWPGGDEALEDAALERADTVIAYGSTEAVAALREQSPPSARFVGYGHRISFGVVARESAGPGSAAAAALDATVFDQQGCVSPHLFYVEEGGDVEPGQWARLLAEQMAKLEPALPRGSLAPGESSAIRQLRAEAEFAQAGGDGTVLHASARGTVWTVVYDADPTFAPSCLNRVVRVKPVPTLERVGSLVAPLADFLQTVGFAAPEARVVKLAEQLGALGASRVVPLGAMAWPPAEWHHDGRPPLGELVRWCDLEA